MEFKFDDILKILNINNDSLNNILSKEIQKNIHIKNDNLIAYNIFNKIYDSYIYYEIKNNTVPDTLVGITNCESLLQEMSVYNNLQLLFTNLANYNFKINKTGFYNKKSINTFYKQNKQIINNINNETFKYEVITINYNNKDSILKLCGCSILQSRLIKAFNNSNIISNKAPFDLVGRVIFCHPHIITHSIPILIMQVLKLKISKIFKTDEYFILSNKVADRFKKYKHIKTSIVINNINAECNVISIKNNTNIVDFDTLKSLNICMTLIENETDSIIKSIKIL